MQNAELRMQNIRSRPLFCTLHSSVCIYNAPKALSAMHLLGKQASLVQLRVGSSTLFDGVCNVGRPPGSAVEPALRQVSYARCAQGSTVAAHYPFASWPQPVDFLCKQVVPGQRRRSSNPLRSYNSITRVQLPEG